MSVVMWIIVPNSCGDSIFAIQQFCKCPHTGCSSEAVGLNRVYVRFYFVRPPGPYTVYIYISTREAAASPRVQTECDSLRSEATLTLITAG